MTAAAPALDDLVDRALEEAPQVLHDGPDFPLEQLPEILSAIQGAAARDVLAMRVEQIAKYGHDAEHDAMLPIDRLPRLAREFGQDAVELLTGIEEAQHLPGARRKLIRMAATTLAAIDRIDAVLKNREPKDG